MKKSATSRPYPSKKSKPKTAGDVRIIGGQFKRRSVGFIDTDGLRPTPDRLRETVFNWLITSIHGARVLDSCAGSGVLGFEALSRGAAHCIFIEAHHAQSEMLKQSAKKLHLNTDSYQIIHGYAEQIFSKNINPPAVFAPFDIIFIDPPYSKALWQAILGALITQQLITTNTVIYLESDKALDSQLNELLVSVHDSLQTQGFSHFECLKQTKVGQVVAGLYCLAPS